MRSAEKAALILEPQQIGNLRRGKVSARQIEETYRIFGYDPSVKPSIATVLERVHPDDVALVRSTIERTATQKNDVDLEYRLLIPDGGVKTVHLRARPLTERVAGKPEETADAQFVGAVMDVTARTNEYAAMQRTEQRTHLGFQQFRARRDVPVQPAVDQP